LSFRGLASEECSSVLNAVINSYKDFLDDTYRNASDDTVKLITQARDVLQKELAEKESAYLEFRKESPLLWKNKDGVPLLQGRLNDVETRRSALQVRKAEVQGRLSTVEGLMKSGRGKAALAAMLVEWNARPGNERQATEASRRRTYDTLEDQLMNLLLQ